MKRWNLSGGSARLEEAIDAMMKTVANLSERWNDPAMDHLQDAYLKPLVPRVQRALEAVHRLDELLSRAARECGDEWHD